MPSLTTLLSLCSLVLATGVLADSGPQGSGSGLRARPGKILRRAAPSGLFRRQSCTGTCQECFGPTSTDCPAGSYYDCYDTAEFSSEEGCSLGGGGATPTSPAGPDTTESSETCFRRGASCQTCFGSTSASCPAGSYYDCYDTANYSEEEGCSLGDGGGATPTSSASPETTESSETCFRGGASCQTCFGSTSASCPAGSYYDCYDTAKFSQEEGCSLGDGAGGSSAPPSSRSSGGASATRTSSRVVNTSTSSTRPIGGSASASDLPDAASTTARASRTPSSSSSSSPPSSLARTSTGAGPSATPASAVSAAAPPPSWSPWQRGKDSGAVVVLVAGAAAVAAGWLGGWGGGGILTGPL